MAGALALAPETAWSQEDEALVVSARESREIFAALYQRHLPRVYRYLRLRAASDEEAADLAQSVFLRAFDALPRYRPGGAPFVAWLFRIARNAATDAHRRRRHHVPLDLVPPTLEPPSGDDPEALALRRERLEGLRALVSGLDQSKRELLALRFGAELSVAEIASTVGKSEAAVK